MRTSMIFDLRSIFRAWIYSVNQNDGRPYDIPFRRWAAVHTRYSRTGSWPFGILAAQVRGPIHPYSLDWSSQNAIESAPFGRAASKSSENGSARRACNFLPPALPPPGHPDPGTLYGAGTVPSPSGIWPFG